MLQSVIDQDLQLLGNWTVFLEPHIFPGLQALYSHRFRSNVTVAQTPGLAFSASLHFLTHKSECRLGSPKQAQNCQMFDWRTLLLCQKVLWQLDSLLSEQVCALTIDACWYCACVSGSECLGLNRDWFLARTLTS